MRYLVALLALGLSFTAFAQDKAETYVEGKHYRVLEVPVRTDDPSKIEVAEVFSYHCGHCFNFEPMLHAWEKQLSPDTYLTQIHAMWNPQMEPLIRGYYTAVTLKVKDKVHMPVFNAIHLENKRFNTAEDWATFFEGFGVPKQKTLDTYNSFGVNSRIKQAEARARGYKVTGTPEIVVDGRYHISSRNLNGQADMLKAAEFLVAKVRAERAKAAN